MPLANIVREFISQGPSPQQHTCYICELPQQIGNLSSSTVSLAFHHIHCLSFLSKTGSGAVGEPPNTRAASRQPPRHFAALSQPSHIFGR